MEKYQWCVVFFALLFFFFFLLVFKFHNFLQIGNSFCHLLILISGP